MRKFKHSAILGLIIASMALSACDKVAEKDSGQCADGAVKPMDFSTCHDKYTKYTKSLKYWWLCATAETCAAWAAAVEGRLYQYKSCVKKVMIGDNYIAELKDKCETVTVEDTDSSNGSSIALADPVAATLAPVHDLLAEEGTGMASNQQAKSDSFPTVAAATAGDKDFSGKKANINTSGPEKAGAKVSAHTAGDSGGTYRMPSAAENDSSPGGKLAKKGKAGGALVDNAEVDKTKFESTKHGGVYAKGKGDWDSDSENGGGLSVANFGNGGAGSAEGANGPADGAANGEGDSYFAMAGSTSLFERVSPHHGKFGSQIDLEQAKADLQKLKQ